MSDKQTHKLLTKKTLTTITLFFLLAVIYNFAYLVFAVGSSQWTPTDTGVLINDETGPPASTDNETRTQIIRSDDSGTPYYIAYWLQYQWNDETNNICAQKYNASGVGQWGTSTSCPVNVYKGADAPATLPRGVPDGDGGIIIVWSDNRNQAGDDINDIFGVRLDSSGSVGSGWTSNGTQLIGTSDSDILYDAVSDETGSTGSPGGIVIGFARDLTTASSTDDYPYITRIDGNASLHSGWSSGGDPVTSVANESGRNIDAGFIHLVTVTDGSDTDSDLDYMVAFRSQSQGSFTLQGYTSRIDSSDGSLTWADEILDNNASYGTGNALAHDGSGGAYYAVVDVATLDLYISHIDSTGTYDTNFPVAVDTAITGSPMLQIIPDGSNGAIVTYIKSNATWIAKVDSTGVLNASWTSNPSQASVNGANGKNHPIIFQNAVNNYVLVWEDDRDGNDNLYSQIISNANGTRQFTADLQLTDTSTDDDITPEQDLGGVFGEQPTHSSIAMTNNNEFLIVWDTANNNYMQILDGTNEEIDLGTTGQLLAQTTSLQYHQRPEVVRTTDGNYITVWEDGREGTHTDIYAQKINTLGVVQWTTNGVGIATVTDEQPANQKISIVPSSDGGAIIAWIDYRDGDFIGDLYTQKIDTDGAVQWTADGVSIENVTNNVVLLADDSGGAYLAWEGSGVDSLDVKVTHIDSTGTVDSNWNTGGIGTFRPLSATSTFDDETEPQIATDSSGNLLISYKKDDGLDSGIYAAKVTSTGAITWTDQTVADSANDEFDQRMVATNDDGMIVSFTADVAGDYNIKAQKLNSSGVAQWTADGTVISDAAFTQSNSRLVSDNITPSSGAIITWQDYRDGTYEDVYAQRIDNLGAVQWTANGIAISDETDNQNQTRPEIASNGGFGAIIVFESYENGEARTDVRAQHLISTGEIQWSAGGEYVEDNTTARFDIDPAIAGDQNGGAVIVWARTVQSEGPPDIYAQYMQDSEGGICSEIGSQSFCGQQEIRNEILTFTNVPDSFTFDEIEAGSAPVIRVYNNGITPPDTEDVIRVYDNRNSGGFTVSVDFKTEFTDDASLGCSGGANCIPYEDLYVATSLNELDPNNGDPGQGEEAGVTYVPTDTNPPTSIPSAVRNVVAPVYVDTDLNDLDDFTSYTTNLSAPVVLMDGGLPAGQGRDGEMWQYANFHLAVGADQEAGNYATILTYTLADDTT